MRTYLSFFLAICCTGLLLLSGSKEVHATHAAGANLTYTCLGGNTYHLRLALYRDCAGISAPTSATVDYVSAACGQSGSVTLFPIPGTGQEITVPCPTAPSTCQGGTQPGLQEWIYEATVTLPANCSDWTFSWDLCCRNNAITNLQNPGNEELYIESKTNSVLAPCNNSPVFTNPPIAFVCINQPFTYNHGVVDPDGDSLSYQIINPLNAIPAPIPYVSPFSPSNPLSSNPPLSIDPVTGDITMNPTAFEVTVVTVLVNEYRNGVLIGSVMRDIQIWVINCQNNNLPTVSGINGSNDYSITVCPDQQLCFDVFSFDPDSGQTVTMTWNQGIPGATFTISGSPHPTGTFCWTPGFNDITLTPHVFTVTVQDDACPVNGVQTYSFTIRVPSPYFTVTSTDVSCNGASDGSILAAPVFQNSVHTYVWSTGDTTNLLTGLQAGTYQVTAYDTSGCSASTSVTINEPPAIVINATVVDAGCLGTCDGEIILVVSGGVPPYAYQWSNGDTSQSTGNLCPGTYVVTVEDAVGCVQTDSFTVGGGTPINITLSVTDVSCFGGNDGVVDLNGSGGTPPYHFQWSNGATTPDLFGVSAGTYCITVRDENQCSVSACATVNQPDSLSAVFGVDDVSCRGGSDGYIDLTVFGGTPPFSYQWSNGATTEDLANVPAGTYTVTVVDANNCTKSFHVVVTEPTTTINQDIIPYNDTSLCFGTSVTLTAQGGFVSYHWSTGDTTQSIQVSNAGVYVVVATNQAGCTATDSVEVLTQVCCFPEGFGNLFTVIDNSNNVVASSDVWSGKYYVTTDVYVQGNATLDLTNVDIVFLEGVGIIFQDNAELRANNSVFRSCAFDKTWAGFDFTGNSFGQINGCIFKNAETGVDINSTLPVRISNSEFINNHTGIMLENAGISLPFNEGITGNTFLMNDNMPVYLDSSGQVLTSAFGIKMFNSVLDGLVSQNDFINASLTNFSSIQFFGIYMNESAATISSNTFTNMFRVLDVTGDAGSTDFDNNTIEYTRKTYSGIHALRITNVLSGPLTVRGNKLTYDLASSASEVGIYAETSLNLIINNNTINGFTDAIQLFTVAFSEVSSNKINNSGRNAIYATGSFQSKITGNTIEGAGMAGISLIDCKRQFAVTKNSVSPGSQNNTFGLIFSILTGGTYDPASISISNNCFRDAYVGMYFNTMRNNNALPLITNNYLYNYSGYGIYNNRFTGSIGGCGSYPSKAGKNSFISNFLPPFGNALDIASVNAQITVAGNSANLHTNFPNVLVNTNCNTTSTASCGNQIGNNEAGGRFRGPLTQIELFRLFIEESYPMYLQGDNYLLHPDFAEVINAVEPESRLSYCLSILDILHDNMTDDQLLLFANAVNTSTLLDAHDLEWFNYHYSRLTGDHVNALQILNNMNPRSADEADLISIEKIAAELRSGFRSVKSLSLGQLALLHDIDSRRGLYAAVARDFIHSALGEHDYFFKNAEPTTAPLESVEGLQPGEDILDIYPNPSDNQVAINYYTADQPEDLSIQFYDATGRLMQSITPESTSGVLTMDISKWSDGVYFIMLKDGKTLLQHNKLVKF